MSLLHFVPNDKKVEALREDEVVVVLFISGRMLSLWFSK